MFYMGPPSEFEDSMLGEALMIAAKAFVPKKRRNHVAKNFEHLSYFTCSNS